MFRKILFYGAIAGIIAGGALSFTTVFLSGYTHGAASMALGYLTMLIALSAVFIAIKRHRDVDQGGVIKFWPAFALGLGISVVAGILYVTAWELTQFATHMDFAGDYSRAMIAARKAKGVSDVELAKMTAEMEAFKMQYANPLYRWPMTFVEIFPVGALVSLISAILLRNPRFLPARTGAS